MLERLLNIRLFNNTVKEYCVSLLIFIVGIIAIYIFKTIIIRLLKSWARKTTTELDDIAVEAFEKKFIPLIYICSFYVSIIQLTLHPSLKKTLDVIVLILMTIFGVMFVLNGIKIFISAIIQKEGNVTKQKALRALNPLIQILVWSFAIFILLENLGIKLTPLIAGLGIGGLAVALAAQNILGDLFAYFVMLFDRPFEIEDFIIIDKDFMGTVEKIGIKSSKIRGIGGEQIIISNTNLANARVRNYKRMNRRRVVFTIGVVYETGLEDLTLIPEIIKEIIQNIDGTTFDRAHFFSYGDFSLNFEIVYYVNSNDYNVYMDIQQEINLKIKDEFEKHNIEFAYPTSLIYVTKSKM
ncbi:MAG TPA: mechanosensitive ion channel family protein [Spirochaetota bacterium]|nr:mechanosensitive ion channel family protein [Spirochaetota bacterium]HOR93697.1 mechanosensitive ion channel family protein [Spirochaetota bacterium]HOT19236.1 mechanosensitive ion channel family protein [Spirochaetota bacterium]HPD04077.1 mechanosensitive ion channel family protein [Spirochaetota bacterium]HQI37097.1 mechanosensitive ion channel family protein [Spirochaetota bacterium]